MNVARDGVARQSGVVHDHSEDAEAATGVFVHEFGRRDALTGRTVVLLHGFSDDGLCWQPFVGVAGWDERCRVLAPDAAGHGRTPLIGVGSDVGEEADRLAARLRELAIDDPCVLIGHSMGALTAAALAMRHPDLVGALVLEDPVWRVGHPLTADRRPKDGSEHPLATHVRRLRRLSHRHRISACRMENPLWSDEEFEAWALAKDAVDLAIFEGPVLWSPAPWWDVASAISAPTLLLTGDPSRGAIVTDEAADVALAALPNGSRAHVETAGHCIRRDAPHETAVLIERFLLSGR